MTQDTPDPDQPIEPDTDDRPDDEEEGADVVPPS